MRFLFHPFDFRILRENSFKHPLVNNNVVYVKGAQINPERGFRFPLSRVDLVQILQGVKRVNLVQIL